MLFDYLHRKVPEAVIRGVNDAIAELTAPATTAPPPVILQLAWHDEPAQPEENQTKRKAAR